MCDDCELAIGFLDLELSGVWFYAERIVVSIAIPLVNVFQSILVRTYVVSATMMLGLIDAWVMKRCTGRTRAKRYQESAGC